jgi:long-chain acyl-CoA synthetase
MNISNLITKNAVNSPGSKAIICGDDGHILSWIELEYLVNKFGNALLTMGVQKGDIVAIYLPNSPEFIIAYFAAARIGAVMLPINIAFTQAEIGYILNNSRAKLLIGSSFEIERHLISALNYFPNLQHIITVGPAVNNCQDFNSLIANASPDLKTVNISQSNLSCLMYTSGTTGKPKGVMLTYNNLMSIAQICKDAVELNDRDLMLTGTPFCHIFFVLTVLAPFNVGAGIVTKRRFHPLEMLELISRYSVTHFAGVPTMYLYMLDHFDPFKFDLRSWRISCCAGAAMPTQYIWNVEKKFETSFIELYGATETSSTITYNRVGHGKPGSVGTPALGVKIKVIDESGLELKQGEIGEILVKSPGLFKGYWELPDATREAFIGQWFRTGDLGKFDDDGYYSIVDRKKDMIISGGYNIYPRELEEVILQHPKVLETAVIGVKDPLLNEIPKAFVRLHNDVNITEQELIQFCSERLAKYKVPRIVKFISELPKNPTGKILKKELIRF